MGNENLYVIQDLVQEAVLNHFSLMRGRAADLVPFDPIDGFQMLTLGSFDSMLEQSEQMSGLQKANLIYQAVLLRGMAAMPLLDQIRVMVYAFASANVDYNERNIFPAGEDWASAWAYDIYKCLKLDNLIPEELNDIPFRVYRDGISTEQDFLPLD